MRLSYLVLSLLVLTACSTEYKTTEASITELEIVNSADNNSHFMVSIEYTVDGKQYTDKFKVYQRELVEDELSTPHPGIKFDIQYNTANPNKNKIKYQVKAKPADS
ncbi:MAG TPA: hypothetical protein PKC24_07735 [Cyclobacteriaceae bacterium]|nr:hypothetical protein [Cyclobacteriaceae bacterium]